MNKLIIFSIVLLCSMFSLTSCEKDSFVVNEELALVKKSEEVQVSIVASYRSGKPAVGTKVFDMRNRLLGTVERDGSVLLSVTDEEQRFSVVESSSDGQEVIVSYPKDFEYNYTILEVEIVY